MSGRVRAVGPDLRRVNQSALLRLLFLEGPLDRVRLGQMTGLSSGTVTNFVASLLEDGLIVEVGREQSEGGRPRILLGVNPEYGAVVGVDIGETGIRVEAFDLDLRVIGVADVTLYPQHVDASVTIAEIARAIEQLHASLTSNGKRLLGVGIGVPGMVEHGGEGARVHAPLIGWHDVPLERQLHEFVGGSIFVENGAKALGQAEMWLGAGRGARHAIVTLWGTGVGAAIFTDGTLYRGATSSAGEWGHTCVVAGGHKCRCGSSGCLEAYIGAESLLDEWRRHDPLATPDFDVDDETWAARLVDAAGDKGAASETLEVAANYFGIGAANLANLFNPEVIVISGWLGLALGPTILERIRAVVSEQALGYTASSVRIELGRFRDDAVVLGASSLVVDEMLRNGGVVPRSVVRSRPGLLARPR